MIWLGTWEYYSELAERDHSAGASPLWQSTSERQRVLAVDMQMWKTVVFLGQLNAGRLWMDFRGKYFQTLLSHLKGAEGPQS